MDLKLKLLATTSLFPEAVFATNTNDAKQIFAHVADSTTSNFVCPVSNCGRCFASKRNLIDHYRGHHQGSRPHACEYPGCGKSFLRPAHLLIHTRIHTGEKPFMCRYPGCNKTWNQKSALKQHLRSHTGEKPFECPMPGCEKKFSTSSSCKRHVATHEKLNQQLAPFASPIQPSSKRKQFDEEQELWRLPNKRTTSGQSRGSFQSNFWLAGLPFHPANYGSDSSSSDANFSSNSNSSSSDDEKAVFQCFVVKQQELKASSCCSALTPPPPAAASKMTVSFLINSRASSRRMRFASL